MTLTHTGTPAFPADPDPALYDQLLRRAHVTGRCPVWIHPDDLEHTLAPVTDPTVMDAVDGRDVLARWWPGPCRPDCSCGDPLPSVIPQAGGQRPAVDPARRSETFDVAVDLVGCRPSGLAVVDAYRPADTPAVLGWAGIGNDPHQDLMSLAAVLRYWESRSGALVAFCPDAQDPQRADGDAHLSSSYVGTIRGADPWHFWRDR